MEPSISSPNRPRLDPHNRQLSRFYEPLVLLHTLGSTRGEHTRVSLFTQEITSCLSLKDLRRRFLGELAYMCDFDKGGDTVSAIGLEFTPQKHTFWVASNSGPKTKVVAFLKLLLTKLKHISATTITPAPEEVEDIATLCIGFATPRIKAYRSHLKPQLKRCLDYLAKTEREDVTGLAEWLMSWGDERSPVDLCRFAYEGRRSHFMRILARLSTEPGYKSNKDAIHHSFGFTRHYIGRLGHHFRGAEALLACAPRLSDILHDFEIRSVPVLSKAAMPPADGKTNLASIIKRMLPAKSPDLDRYQNALADMDVKYQLSCRFLENYTGSSSKPCVHAEIQVLEQFYIGNLQFAGGDPFIACSKPACFCCSLYFRHHPGHVEEPTSHRKIYLNWRPPNLDVQNDTVSGDHQRDILNAMTGDIRKEALRQIHEKTAPQAWHPDSLTGITASIVHEPILDALKELKFQTTNEFIIFEELPTEGASPSKMIDPTISKTTLPTMDKTDFQSELPHHDRETLQMADLGSNYFLDDSDEDGGVLL